jgi:hypothetical protein
MQLEKNQLLEVFSSDAATRVDRGQGIIYGVRILGPVSRNKRKYTPAAISRAKPLYEGKAVNANHERRTDATRPIEDVVGWLRNVREENGGLTGDLHLLKSDPRAEKICEAAERNPTLFGLSHDADGKWVMRDGYQIVEEIERVRSVDIVSDPATTRSLFESYQQGENPMDPATTVTSPTPGGGDTTWQIFVTKAEEIYNGDGDASSKVKGISNILRTLLKVADQLDLVNSGGNKPAGDAPPATSTPEACADKKLPESFVELQAKVKWLESEKEARTLLETAKVPVESALLEAVIALDTPEKKKALVETFQKMKPDERARSASPSRMTESKAEAAKTCDDFVSKIFR